MQKNSDSDVHEDKEAKKKLQGTWIYDEDEAVAMMIKGDTIFYPDSTSQDVTFAVVNDSLVMHNSTAMKYAIVKLTDNIFQFKNSSGDIIKLKRSYDDMDDAFNKKSPIVLNQGQTIKRDTIINYNDTRYRIYTQVNPTTYKVVQTSFNQDGIGVDNIYYDNIINICIYKSGTCLYKSDFRKQDFHKLVPEEYIKKAILNDIILNKVDKDGIHLKTSLGIPDSQTAYIIHTTISYQGKTKLYIDNDNR